MARDPARKLLWKFKEIDGLICHWDESDEKLPPDPQIAAMLNVLREAREKLAELLKSRGITPPYKKKGGQ